MEESAKVEEEEKKSTQKEEVNESIKEYNTEIKNLQYLLERITEEDKKIKEMKEKNERRAQRYKARVQRLTTSGPNPEKWFNAELEEAKREVERGVRMVTQSIYDQGLATGDFIPCFMNKKLDDNDPDSEKQYELKWDTLHDILPKIVEELNVSHPQFVYGIDTIVLPPPECPYCKPDEGDTHACRAKKGLIRIKKEGVKVSQDCLPEENEEEEEEKKEEEEVVV